MSFRATLMSVAKPGHRHGKLGHYIGKPIKAQLRKWYHEVEFDDMRVLRHVCEGWQVLVNVKGDKCNVVLINPDTKEHVKLELKKMPVKK